MEPKFKADLINLIDIWDTETEYFLNKLQGSFMLKE